jgi:hypothetical protein
MNDDFDVVWNNAHNTIDKAFGWVKSLHELDCAFCVNERSSAAEHPCNDCLSNNGKNNHWERHHNARY